MAFDGTNYLVVWTDGRYRLRTSTGPRVSRAGAVLTRHPVSAISTADRSRIPSPPVAFDGTNYLVVWTELAVGHDPRTSTGPG